MLPPKMLPRYPLTIGRALVFCAAGFVLCGCGIKGPLKMPPAKAAQAPAPAASPIAPAIPAAPATGSAITTPLPAESPVVPETPGDKKQ